MFLTSKNNTRKKTQKIIILFLLFCSEGVMIFPPNLADNSGEKYEGQWKDGKMAGYGKLR